MPEKTVIVSDSCPHCQTVKNNIEKRSLPIKIVNYLSEEGKKLVREHNIRAVPECVIIDENGNTKLCTDEEFKEMF